MTFEEYQEKARRTQWRKLPLWATREHALFGLGAEVGEVMDLHQKVHQGHHLDISSLRLEIGDVLWFLAELCDAYGFKLEDIAEANLSKLKDRYPRQFSPKLSLQRAGEWKEPERSKYYAHKKKER